jgi:hypothetical protein
MSTNYENFKDSIDKWADMWEKAQKEGIFKDAPKPHIPSPQTAVDSFFGGSDNKPSERLDEVDAKYWKAVAKLSDNHSFKPELISEVLKEKKVDEAVIAKKDVSDMANAVASSANPIRHSSTGSDQEMNDKSLGNTFSPEDIKALEELKFKLHDLESKLNSFEGKGDNGKKFESQIASVKKKIEELSDALSKGWSISQQGD